MFSLSYLTFIIQFASNDNSHINENMIYWNDIFQVSCEANGWMFLFKLNYWALSLSIVSIAKLIVMSKQWRYQGNYIPNILI